MILPTGDRAERAQQHGDGVVALHERQGAEAAQILGEHDGVGRVLARVELGVDVGEQHGFAGLQHDAADAVAGRQSDAPMAARRFAGAVNPAQRRADERGQPHRHEIETEAAIQVVDRVLQLANLPVKRLLAEIGTAHETPCPLLCSV